MADKHSSDEDEDEKPKIPENETEEERDARLWEEFEKETGGLDERALVAKRQQFEKQQQNLIDQERDRYHTKAYNTYTTHNNLNRNREVHSEVISEQEAARLKEVGAVRTFLLQEG